MSKAVVCSFYTDDEYYRTQAAALRNDLEQLGVEYVIQEMEVGPNEDWADTCRKKVRFLHEACKNYPDKTVFWIDVDCRLLSLPPFVADSTADLIGFTRGFGSALNIGYHVRSRFWEPSFWGIGTSPQARKLVADAAAMEAATDIKATDDYFFEEAWRANSDAVSFQVIPSGCVIGRGVDQPSRDAFFVFGTSGNVEKFKGKVAQHSARRSAPLRSYVLRLGKRVVRQLPPPLARLAIGTADRLGLTASITSEGPAASDRHRRALTNRALRAGLDGNVTQLDVAVQELGSAVVPTPSERALITAAKAFAFYASQPELTAPEIKLCWWVRPFPGNFGDWLSPYIISQFTDRRITLKSPTIPGFEPHLIAVGSIGRFINGGSTVVGTGISTAETPLDPTARYFSVRGPLTAAALRASGGPDVESFGDPAAALSRIVPLQRGVTNGRVAFVRHFSHAKAPVLLPEGVDEFPVLMSQPSDIRAFLETLLRYDYVITSAMHILIVCQSYGVPCGLVTFQGLESSVHGDGTKYVDYAKGAGVGSVQPIAVPLDLRGSDLEGFVTHECVSEDVQRTIEAAIVDAIASFSAR